MSQNKNETIRYWKKLYVRKILGFRFLNVFRDDWSDFCNTWFDKLNEEMDVKPQTTPFLKKINNKT